LLWMTVATSATVTNGNSIASSCYALHGENYCFYSDGSSVLSWDEAREFCTRRNSTLPIITDEDVDDVFQQFIRNTSVWIDARARPVNRSRYAWHWIDRRQTGCSYYLTLSSSCKGRSCLHQVPPAPTITVLCTPPRCVDCGGRCLSVESHTQ